MNWHNRPKKQIAREYVLADYEQKHGALFLPGWVPSISQCGQDIRTGLAMGALSLHKPLYVAERNEDWAPLIFADLQGLGFTKIIMHVGELSDMIINHQIDFAFIDLMGCLTIDLCQWMRDVLSPKLITNATVAFTSSFGRRNNHFIRAAERVMFVDHQDYRNLARACRIAYSIEGREKLLPLILTKSIFQNHQFAYQPLYPYRDNVRTMLTYKFTEFAKANTPSDYPSLADITAKFTKKETKNMVKDTPRSKAANKAWETRRAKQAEIKLAEAERQSSLSARALKAWATRRANGWVHPANRLAA